MANVKFNNIYRDMCNRYGAHLPARFKKLFEEIEEPKQAEKEFEKSGELLKAIDLLDELGDVIIILTHICGIIGIPIEAIIKMTHAKIKERDTNPEFKHNT